ncbi:unnamed protein product [Acidithrix sp. C25]|nr:unnamed protein product [Acidithrix sp. C25]
MHLFLKSLLVAFLVTQVAIFCTTVFLHRAASHRALKLSKPLTYIFRTIIWLTTGIKPRQWVAVHRVHHAYTDVPGDPHSPIVEGFAAIQFGNVYFYRRTIRIPGLVERYAKDLAPDKMDKIVYDRSLLGLGIGIVILWLTFGWELALITSVLHTAMYLLLSGAINAIGHTYGRRPYDNLATNNNWLALLTAGEGLHNNHHAAPTSAKLALGKRQIDPSWPFIKVMVALGQATIRHSEPKFVNPKRITKETIA